MFRCQIETQVLGAFLFILIKLCLSEDLKTCLFEIHWQTTETRKVDEVTCLGKKKKKDTTWQPT